MELALREITEQDLPTVAAAYHSWIARYPQNGEVKYEDILSGLREQLGPGAVAPPGAPRIIPLLVSLSSGEPVAYGHIQVCDDYVVFSGGRLPGIPFPQAYLSPGIRTLERYAVDVLGKRTARIGIWRKHFKLAKILRAYERIGFKVVESAGSEHEVMLEKML